MEKQTTFMDRFIEVVNLVLATPNDINSELHSVYWSEYETIEKYEFK